MPMRLFLTLALALALVLPSTTLAAGMTNPSVGKRNAPITMQVWFDYECPFCKSFHKDVLSSVEDYAVGTGVVRIVYRDFQFLGEDSTTAALYSRAIWKTSRAKWAVWHDLMMRRTTAENEGGIESIRTAVREAGLDLAKVEKTLKKNKSKYTKAINKDRAAGTKLGVNGTPSTLIDGELIAGAVPLQTINDAIWEARDDN